MLVFFGDTDHNSEQKVLKKVHSHIISVTYHTNSNFTPWSIKLAFFRSLDAQVYTGFFKKDKGTKKAASYNTGKSHSQNGYDKEPDKQDLVFDNFLKSQNRFSNFSFFLYEKL